MILQPTDMEFCYRDVFDTEPPEAYERLILDAMTGDSTLFIRADEVDAAWSLVDSILQGWAEEASPHIYPYITGSWGSQAADEFMNKDNRKWTKF